jgi:hypothetical protein
MTNCLIMFSILSTIFIYFKSTMEPFPYYMYILFLLLVILTMLSFNYSILLEHCGNTSALILVTSLLPWIFIFGSMMYLLQVFPWWLTPFSNTFGLLIARFNGCNNTFLKMLKPKENQLVQSLHYVYTDPTLIINKFTLYNFENTYNSLSSILNETSEFKEEFKQCIKLKEGVSEWIWYLLTASIATSISYTTLMTSKCKKTTAQYIDNHNNAVAQTEPVETPTEYTVTE